jgi:hypothetical protein
MKFVKIFYYECAAQAMVLARIEYCANKVLCDRVVYPTLITGLGFQLALSLNYGY